MEEAKEVNITYETLFELLKREKDTNDLQKLDADFFNKFVDYINEKKKMLDLENSFKEEKDLAKRLEELQKVEESLLEEEYLQRRQAA